MKFSLIFLFLFLIVLTPMVVAQPPQATPVIINLEAGLAIDFPKIIEIRQNQDFEFHFHVFNATSGLAVDNTTTNCSLELLNGDGSEIIDIDVIDFVGDEWNINVLGGNFSRLGSYYWLVNCQSSLVGGFTSAPLIVTADGFSFSDFPIQLSLIIFSFFLLVFGLVKERFRLFQFVGSILMMVMGVLTLYPGYSFINWTTLTGLALGTVLIGIGFYFLIEPAFSRDEQAEYFGQGGGD